MAPQLVLSWDQTQLAPLRARGLERALFNTLSKAGGDTIRAMRTAASRAVRFRKQIRAETVRKGLVLRRSSGRSIEDLEWRIDVSGKAIPLGDYPRRQLKRGVSVAVNKGGRKIIAHAFIARMKSNHVGVFVRRTRGPGSGRLPIDELFSSRISDVIQDSGAVDAIFARGSAVFSTSFSRLLPLELTKAGAK